MLNLGLRFVPFAIAKRDLGTIFNKFTVCILRPVFQTTPAAHVRYLLSPAAGALPKKYKILNSGFLSKLNPMQPSCSDYNAFYSNTYPSVQSL